MLTGYYLWKGYIHNHKFLHYIRGGGGIRATKSLMDLWSDVERKLPLLISGVCWER